MYRCKITGKLCDFALKSGSCSQFSLSVQYLRCGEKKLHKKITKQELRVIYDKEFAQAGDTEKDFTNWAIDYLIENRDKQFLGIIKRHLQGIMKAVETLERE